MEKLFQPEPAAERRASALGPRSRARLRSPAGASARTGRAAPSGAEAGAISKSFQEVSGRPHPACVWEPLSRRPPAAPLLCGALRRAGLRRWS